jgi:hypothetical protein
VPHEYEKKTYRQARRPPCLGAVGAKAAMCFVCFPKYEAPPEALERPRKARKTAEVHMSNIAYDFENKNNNMHAVTNNLIKMGRTAGVAESQSSMRDTYHATGKKLTICSHTLESDI